MYVLVFEDERIRDLYPITTGRAGYAINCGGYCLFDWLKRLNQPLCGLVRPHLAAIQEVAYPELGRIPNGSEATTLLVNARVVPSRNSFETLQHLIEAGRFGVIRSGDDVAAALVPSSSLSPSPGTIDAPLSPPCAAEELQRFPALGTELSVFRYPHDVIRHHLDCFTGNLNHRIEHGDYREIRDGVLAAEGATIGDFVVTDTRQGPIVLDRDARIGPYCYLSGPAYLGASARVIEHSAIKDAVAIGHTTKIGGEVEASIVEAYTNKQHHGFLGHSYLGSWINLGAGTCNSDLKNTYGEVKMEYRGRRVSTGMQFVGCVMGDYSKTAINTGIFTGKTIGVCSMLYGFVTTNVPSFVNYARSFGQVTELPPEVMISTQKRMFLRRNVTQRPCDIQLLHDMFELTHFERQIAGEPLAL